MRLFKRKRKEPEENPMHTDLKIELANLKTKQEAYENESVHLSLASIDPRYADKLDEIEQNLKQQLRGIKRNYANVAYAFSFGKHGEIVCNIMICDQDPDTLYRKTIYFYIQPVNDVLKVATSTANVGKQCGLDNLIGRPEYLAAVIAIKQRHMEYFHDTAHDDLERIFQIIREELYRLFDK